MGKKKESPAKAKNLREQVEKFFYSYRLDDPAAVHALRDLNLLDEAYKLEELRVNTLQLQQICTRLKELAEHAAREDISDAARAVLQREADQLVTQYNAILERTDFSKTAAIGRKLDKLGFYVQ